MVLLRMVCALVAACAVSSASGQWLATTFDGNYWREQPTYTEAFALNASPRYFSLLTRAHDPRRERLHPREFLNSSLSFDIALSGDGTLVFRGQNTWNTCPKPAFVRFFFTDSTNVYSPVYASQHPNNFWWSKECLPLDAATIGALTTVVTPNLWSNGNGGDGADNAAAFIACAAGCRRVGISFGGGCYYDVGIAETFGDIQFVVAWHQPTAEFPVTNY